MRKERTDDDQIEITLGAYGIVLYELLWRYKEPRKFLWFNIKDRWKTLTRYDPIGGRRHSEDPNNDIFLENVTFNLGRESDVQAFKSLKNKIKTKRDLYNFYNVYYLQGKYEKDLADYKKFKEELKNNIKELCR